MRLGFFAGTLASILDCSTQNGKRFALRNKAAPAKASEIRALCLPGCRAQPPPLLVVIVLGGILGGLFSAIEASAIAAAYCLFLGMVVYREMADSRIFRASCYAARSPNGSYRRSIIDISRGALDVVHGLPPTGAERRN